MFSRSTTIRTRRPRGAAPSFVLNAARGRAAGGAAASASISRPTYSAETTCRGRPSTFTSKSAAREADRGTARRVHDAHVDGDEVDPDPEHGRLR